MLLATLHRQQRNRMSGRGLATVRHQPTEDACEVNHDVSAASALLASPLGVPLAPAGAFSGR